MSRFAAAVSLLTLMHPGAAIAQTPVPAVTPANVASQSATARATETIEETARRAADIFRRIPCSKKGAYLEGSLPGIARKFAAGQPVTIVAFGSSSTSGHGATSPIFSYPYRLADQLRRKFPRSDLTVLNRGVGGEDTPQMMNRLQSAVLDAKPDMVIWQLGTNTVVRGDESEMIRTEALVNDGLDRLKLTGADVVLIDPQYVPATAEKAERTGKMVDLLKRVAEIKKVARFPRFEVMRNWHDEQKLPFDDFVVKDGLHMNDWGYACFAQLLGDTIIDSVTRLQAGHQALKPDVLLYRPK